MEIRRALPADAGPLAALLTRFFAEEGFAVSAAEIRERADVFLAEAANAAFLAFEEGTPAGAATLTHGLRLETGCPAARGGGPPWGARPP